MSHTPPSSIYAPSSPRTKRAAPDPSEEENTKPPTSPKPLPRSYHDGVAAGQGQAGSKSKPPVTAPKPVTGKGNYDTPRLMPASSELGIPRSNSFEHPALSAALKEVVGKSMLQKSSSMDENLNSAVHHPLQKSSLASEYRCVSPQPSSQASSSLVSHSLSSTNPCANVRMTGSKGTVPLTPNERVGENDREQKSLESFLKQRQQDLPLRIKVCNGYLGDMETNSMASGDEISLHFLKHTEVIEAEHLKQKYYIPLNSAVNARVLYEGGLNPYNLTVSDIMAANEPPLVVKAVCRYQCSSDKHSVDEDELFVVEGVKTVILSRFLQVYSVTHQVGKKLKVDCNASFTTNATLYMPDIVQHLSAKFPLKAVLYFDQDTSHSNSLSGSEVNLLKHRTRSTVIASLHEGGKIDMHSISSSLLEVSTDCDITVVEVSLNKDEKKALVAQTQNLLKKRDPSAGVSVVSTNGQTVQLVRKGYEHTCYRLDVSPSLASSEPSHPKNEHHKTVDSEEDEEAGDYEKVEPSEFAAPLGNVDEKNAHYAAGNADLGSLAVQVNAMRRSVETMQTQTNVAESLSRSNKNQVASLKVEVMKIKSSLEEMEQAVAALTKKVESVLTGGMSQMNTIHADDNGVVTRRDHQDTVLLELLSKHQVLVLLKSMGLEQYQKSFEAEEVDGAILVQCNEHVLEHELGVTSKIHIIRLMKVIKEKAVANVFNRRVA